MSLSHVFLLFCLCVTLFQLNFRFATSNPSGLTLRAFIDDSPSSPLYRIENLTRTERIERLINVTNARAKYLNLVLNPNATVVPDNIRLPVLREGLYYAVAFKLGSQQHIVKLLLDTGGGLIWTQCLPCTNCFPQKLPIFNPTASTTYATLPCNHQLCQGDDRRFTCQNGKCIYNAQYGGGSTSNGVASTDSFRFYIDRSTTQPFSLVFGCSDDSRNILFQNTDISGIFGLNLAPESMVKQLSTTIHSRFSYCLIPFTDGAPRPLLLRFGEDIPKLSPQQVQSTLIMQFPGKYYYNLELLDISVADYRLAFPPSTFQIRAGGRGGCFIDSGALLTQIDDGTVGVNAYEAVLQVFAAYYGARNVKRKPDGPKGLELCYELPDKYNDFASLTFHFNGADYTVAGRYTNYFSQGSFCIAILRGKVSTVLGAWQQQNKRIIHDGLLGELQFADENCINDIS